MANKKSMTKQEIMDAIEALAHSQGYYARLYGTLKEHCTHDNGASVNACVILK